MGKPRGPTEEEIEEFKDRKNNTPGTVEPYYTALDEPYKDPEIEQHKHEKAETRAQRRAILQKLTAVLTDRKKSEGLREEQLKAMVLIIVQLSRENDKIIAHQSKDMIKMLKASKKNIDSRVLNILKEYKA